MRLSGRHPNPVRRCPRWTVFGLAFLLLAPVPAPAQEKAAPVAAGQAAGGNGLGASSDSGVDPLTYARPGLLSDLKGSTWIKPVDMEEKQLTLVAGRSQVLRLQRKVARISVSNPDIVDAVILSPMEVLLNARTQGAVNVIFWDYLNEMSVFDITVTRDPNLLYAVLHRIAPETAFEVFPSNDVFVIKGEVDSVSKQREVEQAASAFAEGSVSLVRVREAKQVLLKIRFVELDHTQGYDFGIDMEYDLDTRHESILQRFTPGGTGASTSGDSTGSFRHVDPFEIFDRSDTDMYSISYFQPNRYFLGYLKALEAQGVSKIIARPNLLASDGQEASFLVGGEAAVVAISSDSVGVEYREFGTRLTFTPQILPSGKIRLTVAPEVSALDFANGVTVNDVVIPSFTTIRTSTVVELENNETFMIGGLLQQKLTVNDSGVPFLRRIPLIGKLFDNTDHNYQDTELLVLITPVLVDPMDAASLDGTAEGKLVDDATSLLAFKGDNPQRDAIADFIEDYGTPPFRRTPPAAEAGKEEDAAGAREVKKMEPAISMQKETKNVEPAPVPPAPEPKKTPLSSAPKAPVRRETAASAETPKEKVPPAKKTAPPAPVKKEPEAKQPASLEALEAELQWDDKDAAGNADEPARKIETSGEKASGATAPVGPRPASRVVR